VKDTTTQDQYITLVEASGLTGLCEVSLRRAQRRGELTFYKAADYKVRLNRAELEQWLAERNTPRPIEAPRAGKKQK
jgi:hypothetical protein